MKGTDIAAELVRTLERVEAEACRDQYDAADGFFAEETGAGLLLCAPQADVLTLNRVLGFGMPGPADAVDEGAVDEMIRRYDEAGVSRFFVQLSPVAEAAGAIPVLLKHGFRHHNNWMQLYHTPDEPSNVPPPSSDLEIRRVGQEYAGAIADMVVSSFGFPDASRALYAAIVARDRWSHYAAFSGSTPAATGALYVNPPHAHLIWAATLPEYRGRGAQRALVEARLQEARSKGCTLVTAETSDDLPGKPSQSYRNLVRIGFRPAYRRPNYVFELKPGAFGEEE